ncbi:MAG: hypothetical protein WC374_06815 [Phycisphaerae bacterium]|jgi:hypothetical protein
MKRECPRKYRGLYERAMKGKSRKAAMHAFCLECCYWQIKEVRLCGDLCIHIDRAPESYQNALRRAEILQNRRTRSW